MINERIKAIRTEEEYESALVPGYALMNADPGSDELDELDALTDLIEQYEYEHEPMGVPSPTALREFRFDQQRPN